MSSSIKGVLKKMVETGGRAVVFSDENLLIVGTIKESDYNEGEVSLSLSEAFSGTPCPTGDSWMSTGLHDTLEEWKPVRDETVCRCEGEVTHECIQNDGNICLFLKNQKRILLLLRDNFNVPIPRLQAIQ